MSFERVEVVDAPSLLPLTVQDVKDYLRIEGHFDDQVVLTCIKAASDWVGSKDGCGYALLRQKWRHYPRLFNADDNRRRHHWYWQNCPLNLPLPGYPLASAEGRMLYTARGDMNETETAVDITHAYRTGRLFALAPTDGWPISREPQTRFAIEYEVGHTSPADIPHDLRMAVRILAARFYEHRGTAEPDAGVERLLTKYRRLR